MTKRENCVVLVCNRKFLAYALFVAHQLTRDSAGGYDVVIASAEDLGDAVNAPLLFRRFKAAEFIGRLPETERLGQYTYWRIPAIESLSNDYRNILYLDTDIFCTVASVSSIFSIDLEGCPLAAVRDVHQSVRPGRKTRESKLLGIESGPYFNAGVLLVNSANWRSSNCYESIQKIADLHSDGLVCHDQSLLNLLVAGKWIELSPVWNWQYSYRNCFLTDWVSPKFIHFAGAKKLWHAADGTIPRRYWEEFKSFRAEILNESSADEYPVLDPSITKALFNSLLKNAWYARSYFRYLQKFPDELTVVRHGAA
jgi:lipopolysaccharide biosynthesis glycosyltransferase